MPLDPGESIDIPVLAAPPRLRRAGRSGGRFDRRRSAVARACEEPQHDPDDAGDEQLEADEEADRDTARPGCPTTANRPG